MLNFPSLASVSRKCSINPPDSWPKSVDVMVLFITEYPLPEKSIATNAKHSSMVQKNVPFLLSPSLPQWLH